MICIPLSAATNAEMRDVMAKAETQPADMIELRLDSLREPPHTEELLKLTEKPVIVSCRSLREGGKFDGGDQDRRDILLQAARLGCAYLDVETGDLPFIAGNIPSSTTLIVSIHDYAATPENLIDRVRELAALPADWVKFSVTPGRPEDSLLVLDAIGKCPKPCIGIAMGEAGLMTRVLGPAYGSRIAYAALEKGFEPDSGQLPTARDMAEIYRVKTITRDTRVYGLLGNPVSQSRGYRLHNQAFAAIGHDAVYIPFLSESAEDFLRVVPRAINLHGLSVTIPHKPAACRWADYRSENADRIGAANTLTRTPSGWRANNTDMPGIFESIKAAISGAGMNLTGTDALIFGSGGTTRAAGMALSLLGCRITLASRNPERAWQIASRMGWEVEGMTEAVNGRWKVVANTTPVGMYPHIDETLFPAEKWREDMLAFDAVHNPQMTRFLSDAAMAGAVIVDGVEMFLRQAAEQFRHWTGQEMPKIASLTSRRGRA